MDGAWAGSVGVAKVQQVEAPPAPAAAAPLAPLALYRRYRPEIFAEVIGQDHVTEPLRHALAGNRVHHAYLFSGPRGCGKTTSARILARALNCERAPVAEPCGQCQSCRDLARGGPGSLDVIEIDAASHGGVDDARDLRERAFFTPVASRYKVYVIDEAHMVTTQGFNALLKLVEEPPPHLKFIFATTEPDKVIGTIRSRTHHYPFRLVPPRLLTDYLLGLCEREGVQVEPTALPLVVRAGGGSVRDTLSVLDQLIGGAGDTGVTYALAAGLLGYTPDWLLDEVVDAFAASDGASVFGAVDKVVETGQDPRRFAEDLLQRLRDLIIVASVPDAVGSGVLHMSTDAAERLEGQAARFGTADLTRAAEVVSAGLDEIRGATAPRLLLELICARVLLPGADASLAGVQARLDRLERRVSIEVPLVETDTTPGQPAATGAAATDSPAASTPGRSDSDASPAAPPGTAVGEPPSAAVHPAPAGAAHSPSAPAGAHMGAQANQSGLGLAEVRRAWPDVLAHLSGLRRLAWMLLSRDSHVVSVEASTLTVSVPNAGARDSFSRCGGEELLRQSMIDVLGVDWRVDVVVEPGGSGAAPRDASRGRTAPPSRGQPAGEPAQPAGEPARSAAEPVSRPAPRSADAESEPGAPDAPAVPGDAASADVDPPAASTATGDAGGQGSSGTVAVQAPSDSSNGGEATSLAPPDSVSAGEATSQAWPEPVRPGGAATVPDPAGPAESTSAATPSPEPVESGSRARTESGPRRSAQAREAIRPTRRTGSPADRGTPDTDAHPDDPSLDDDGLRGAELLASRLGAHVIEEIPHDP